MSRSRNSRKGATNRGGGRHQTCREGKTCPYCARNKIIASERQKQKGVDARLDR